MSTGRIAGAFVCAAALLVGCRGGESSSPGNGGGGGSPSASSATGTGGDGGAAGGGGASSGGGGSAPLPHCEATDPRTVPATVWAEPDADEAPYVDSLTKAKSKIRVVVYEMGTGGILDTLEAKAKAGVDVRIILDQAQKGINQKYFDELTAAGAKVQWSDPQFTYTHAKSFVVDDVEAIISTGNYRRVNLESERNFVVRDDDADDVASLAALLDADWNKTSPDLSCTRLIVSPVNARQRILDLIASAKTTLDVESMEFADDDVRAAVVARKDAGVAVRVLLADPSWISDNTGASVYLAQHGIAAQRLADPHLHVKAISVDGVRAYVGSENFSYTSLDENREVGLAITELAGVKVIEAAFATDWAASSAF